MHRLVQAVWGRARGFGVVLASTFVAAALWLLVFGWPMARYFDRAVPTVNKVAEHGRFRMMTQGDHLQLVYHFELVAKMLAGKTRWFHNVYEFNTGDDAARFEPGGLYVPFSLFYAAGRLAGANEALAYNLAILLTLWLMLLGHWLLARSFTAYRWLAALGVVFALSLPYLWANLMGGSPNGFALMWTPFYLYGLDMAVRGLRRRGGWLAGLAILGLAASDTHGLLFSLLLTPGWVLLLLLLTEDFTGRHWQDYGRRLRAGWPLLLGVGAAVLLNTVWHRGLEDSVMGAGRSLREIALYSPFWRGLFQSGFAGSSHQIYIGVFPVLLFTMGGLAAAWNVWRRRQTLRAVLAFALLGAVMVLVVFVALGPVGPFQGAIYKAFRWVVPPVGFVRQPFKVFSLIPALFSVAAVFSVGAVLSAIPGVRMARWVTGVLMLCVGLDYKRQSCTTVSGLATHEPAYQAVAADAAQKGVVPHVVALPLWPGDSTWTAPCLYYGLQQDLRMLNGYKPAVPQSYIRNVFDPLQIMNQGWLAEAQLRLLEKFGVQYLILHEDLFPEKVSPFPAAVTLERLLQNPHLRLLKQSGPVWAFRLQEQPEPVAPAGLIQHYFPARFFTAPKLLKRELPEGVAVLRKGEAPIGLRLIPMGPYENLQWQVRVRGRGALLLQQTADPDFFSAGTLKVDAPDWEWLPAPLSLPAPVAMLEGFLRGTYEEVALESILLAAGPAWTLLRPGEEKPLPATEFFHAGYTDLDKRCVVLRPDWDADTVAFYGPRLPFAPGRYRIHVACQAAAPQGTLLGRLNVRRGGDLSEAVAPVIQGLPVQLDYVHPDNRVLCLEFTYSRAAPMEIYGVRFSRLEDRAPVPPDPVRNAP